MFSRIFGNQVVTFKKSGHFDIIIICLINYLQLCLIKILLLTFITAFGRSF